MTSIPPASSAKDFLSILDLVHVDLERLLGLAAQMKADRRLRTQAPTASALAGRHVALLFEKPSLRTRSTFEIAVRELGGETLHVAVGVCRRVARAARGRRAQPRALGARAGRANVRAGQGGDAWPPRRRGCTSSTR